MPRVYGVKLTAEQKRAVKAHDVYVDRLDALRDERAALIDEMRDILDVYKFLHVDSAESAAKRRIWVESLLAKRMKALAAIDERIPPAPPGPVYLNVHQSIRPRPFFLDETADGPMQHPEAAPATRRTRRTQSS
jgi:hypothetical protein